MLFVGRILYFHIFLFQTEIHLSMSVVLGLGRLVQRPALALGAPALVRMGRAAHLLPALQARLLSATPPTHHKIDQLVKDSKVVVFMKGVPEAPQCGFSNAVVQIMRFGNVQHSELITTL